MCSLVQTMSISVFENIFKSNGGKVGDKVLKVLVYIILDIMRQARPGLPGPHK